MKPIRNLLLFLAVPVVLVFGLVNLLAVPLDEIPPPDPSMVISMPDGSDRTLAELVALSEAASPDDETWTAPGEGKDRGPSHEGLETPVESARRWRWSGPPDGSDLVDLAEYKLHQGELEDAAALLRSVPSDHPRYPRVMRRLGWDVYARGLDDPARGVAFVNVSLKSDPLDGNACQDAYRVYLRGLGVGLD